jgi:hypothetical protein
LSSRDFSVEKKASSSPIAVLIITLAHHLTQLIDQFPYRLIALVS